MTLCNPTRCMIWYDMIRQERREYQQIPLTPIKPYGSKKAAILCKVVKRLGILIGCPSISWPTIADKFATTVVNSRDEMSSIQPSDKSIITELDGALRGRDCGSGWDGFVPSLSFSTYRRGRVSTQLFKPLAELLSSIPEVLRSVSDPAFNTFFPLSFSSFALTLSFSLSNSFSFNKSQGWRRRPAGHDSLTMYTSCNSILVSVCQVAATATDDGSAGRFPE